LSFQVDAKVYISQNKMTRGLTIPERAERKPLLNAYGKLNYDAD